MGDVVPGAVPLSIDGSDFGIGNGATALGVANHPRDASTRIHREIAEIIVLVAFDDDANSPTGYLATIQVDIHEPEISVPLPFLSCRIGQNFESNLALLIGVGIQRHAGGLFGSLGEPRMNVPDIHAIREGRVPGSPGILDDSGVDDRRSDYR